MIRFDIRASSVRRKASFGSKSFLVLFFKKNCFLFWFDTGLS